MLAGYETVINLALSTSDGRSPLPKATSELLLKLSAPKELIKM